MNLLARLFPSRSEPADDTLTRSHRTGQFIPSRKEQQRRANEASVKMEFAILTARLSPEERAAFVERGSVCSLTDEQKKVRA